SSFHSHPPPPALPSFPTRRSSDLSPPLPASAAAAWNTSVVKAGTASTALLSAARSCKCRISVASSPLAPRCRVRTRQVSALSLRSEEHTSELQSRFDLVCRLLLEK